MKKVAFALVLVAVLLSLCGCVDHYYFDYDNLKNNVQTIEIIEYDPDTQDEHLLSIISESEQEQILLELSQLEYHYYILGDPISPKGHCLKLTYKNNDYEIISYAGTTQNGFIQCDKSLFEEMLQRYLVK